MVTSVTGREEKRVHTASTQHTSAPATSKEPVRCTNNPGQQVTACRRETRGGEGLDRRRQVIEDPFCRRNFPEKSDIDSMPSADNTLAGMVRSYPEMK